MRRAWVLIAVLILTLVAGVNRPAFAAEEVSDCDSPETEKRIPACTELIETPGLNPTRRATAYANRALAYALRGEFETAIGDYNAAIAMFPEFAVALNNRAWAYFKWGKLAEASVDVERSLAVEPQSAHTLDTRAHISQWKGNAAAAIRDYDAAILFGGARMVTLYQCGLKMARLYNGPNDGVVRPELKTAMRICIEKGSACDPLPPDEECREATS